MAERVGVVEKLRVRQGVRRRRDPIVVVGGWVGGEVDGPRTEIGDEVGKFSGVCLWERIFGWVPRND